MTRLHITVDLPEPDRPLIPWTAHDPYVVAGRLGADIPLKSITLESAAWETDLEVGELVEGSFGTPPVQIVVHADIAEMMRSIPNSWTSASFRELLDKILMLIASTKDTPNA